MRVQEVMRVSANSGCCVGIDFCANNDSTLAAEFCFEAPLGQVIGYAKQQ